MVPADRIAVVKQERAAEGEFVLYVMIANRRPGWNQALERAVEHAVRLRRPLLVCEYLGCTQPWASVRVHRLIVEGMQVNRAAFARTRAHYVPCIEERGGQGARFLRGLVGRACVVITDRFPVRAQSDLVAELAAEAPCPVEAVDGNGLLPLQATEGAHARAVDFRRHLHRTLAPHLGRFPKADPLAGVRLPRLRAGALPPSGDPEAMLAGGLARLPIDHTVGPVELRGGYVAARRRMQEFLALRLGGYGVRRDPLIGGSASGLSSYLHLGHISAHEVVEAVWRREGWTPDRLGAKATGAKAGWWGMSVPAEAFLDQLVTWRELGHQFAWHRPDHDAITSLPQWALRTLDAHRADRRAQVYSLERFESASTHDPLWNAAQRQLRGEGVIHTYLRMLWGKKVIEWSDSPEQAWAVLDHLNNRWAIDGSNPNSWSGIAWCFGRFDRPWAPQRPVFGSVRWMSSLNTARKMDVKPYLARWGGG